MCFPPEWRALFQHLNLNFQKCSNTGVFCTFWLRKVLCATTAGTFSTAQLPKVLRTPSVFNTFDFEMCFAPQGPLLFQHLNFQKCSESVVFLTSESASRHSGVEFFISHLHRWRRTRRFSEPTFRPSWAPKHWKRKRNVSRLCYLFAHLHLLSSDSFSSSLHLCFSILLFHLPTL